MYGQQNIKFRNQPPYGGRLARNLCTIPPS